MTASEGKQETRFKIKTQNFEKLNMIQTCGKKEANPKVMKVRTQNHKVEHFEVAIKTMPKTTRADIFQVSARRRKFQIEDPEY